MSDPVSKTTELRLILAMAPTFQVGPSKIGKDVAEYLSIPFPMKMSTLEKIAKEAGFSANDLWPWLKLTREKRNSHDGGWRR